MAKQPKKLEETTCAVLRHPVRVRILEVLDEQDISPVEFYRRGLLPIHPPYRSQAHALSQLSYHFRTLARSRCIEVTTTNQKRGAVEHVYRGRARAFHSDEDLAELPFEERRGISQTTLQSLVARADSAIIAGTFDKRPDRHLSWVAMDVDEEAWAELRDLQEESLKRAEAIKAAAAERVAAGAESVRATFGALGFESPPLAAPRPEG